MGTFSIHDDPWVVPPKRWSINKKCTWHRYISGVINFTFTSALNICFCHEKFANSRVGQICNKKQEEELAESYVKHYIFVTGNFCGFVKISYTWIISCSTVHAMYLVASSNPGEKMGSHHVWHWDLTPFQNWDLGIPGTPPPFRALSIWVSVCVCMKSFVMAWSIFPSSLYVNCSLVWNTNTGSKILPLALMTGGNYWLLACRRRWMGLWSKLWEAFMSLWWSIWAEFTLRSKSMLDMFQINSMWDNILCAAQSSCIWDNTDSGWVLVWSNLSSFWCLESTKVAHFWGYFLLKL